jgi:hypothetical protein
MKWVYDFHKAHKELLLYENHRVRMRNGWNSCNMTSQYTKEKARSWGEGTIWSFPLVGTRVRSLQVLLHTVMYVFRFMITFTSCFMMGKSAHWWMTFPKCKAGLSYHLILGPLFWNCPHPSGALPCTLFKGT